VETKSTCSDTFWSIIYIVMHTILSENQKHVAAQCTKSLELKDYPRMIKVLDEKEWQEYFMNEAKRISSSQVE
jgi:hypothetical protein